MQLAIEDFPEAFADITGITEASAQVILSIIVLATVLLPVMYLSKGKKGTMLEAIFAFLTLTMLVGIGWAPFWLLITTMLVMAVVVAMFGTSAITGSD